MSDQLNWDDPLAGIPSFKKETKQNQGVVKNAPPAAKPSSDFAALDIEPVNPNDKRVVNGKTDINQLAPFKYPWAWDYFLNANKNHWTPLDINMAQDVQDYNNNLTLEERHLYENVLSYLTTSDILAMRNIGLAVMEKMSAPELQIYQARQVFDEALHCYEEGTEVLTNKGFLDFREVQPETLIAQYNKEGSIEFVHHLGITADDFNGELVQFKSSVYHTSVTPNHRCVSFNLRKDNALDITHAEDLSPSNRDFPVAGKISGNETITLSDIDKLRIAYQADGTLSNNGAITSDNTIMYRWHLRKERKIERLLMLINRLKLRYKQSGEYIYVWIDAELKFLKDFTFVDLAKVSFQWARDFIVELTLWDGSQSSNMNCYSSTNESCINIATAIGAIAHYRVGTSISQTSAGNKYYTLNFIDKSVVSGRSIKKTTKAYTGKVYSVGVPSTMIITRYQYKVCVSGNTWTYQHCIETLGLNQSEIYNRYRVVPAINAKIQLSNQRLSSILRPNIDLNDRDELENFVMAYIFFAGIFEGCWFYNGFSPIFALQRRGLMKGTAEQLQYIMRDEVLHASFGIRVINQIIQEENLTLDPQKLKQLWEETEAVEAGYAHYILKDPILGYNAKDHIGQFRFIANRRARQLHIAEPFAGAKNTLPWLDEQANLRKEKNFFETRVTEYQTGGALNWD